MSRLRLLLAIVLSTSFIAASHTDAAADSNAELWSELGVRHKLNKRWRLSLDQGLRLDDSASNFSSVLSELGVSYKAGKWLRLAAGYRFSYRESNGGNRESRHRVQLDARAKVRRGKLAGFYRLRLQELTRSKGNRMSLRNLIGVQYRASRRFEPFSSAEVFHTIDSELGNPTAKVRFTVGTAYVLNKRAFDIFYRYEDPIDDETDPVVHIVGLGYTLSI